MSKVVAKIGDACVLFCLVNTQSGSKISQNKALKTRLYLAESP